MAYTGNSITDYLSSTGQNTSFNNRATLAQKYGIKDYTGSASQNLSLLNTMRGSQAAPATATATPAPAKPAAPKVTSLQQVVNNAKQNTANLQKQYQNSENVKTANQMMNMTIEGLEKKYGFDFSRSYAAEQAEAEAQAQRNAYNNSARQNETMNKETLAQLQASLSEGNQALDHSFFQNYLAQRQSQANTGMNAGIAAEQDLRLGMNQQAQLASMYRDANLARNQESNRFNNESMRIREALDLVEQERLANENSLFQQLRQQAYETLSQERNTGISMDKNEWGKLQDRIAREFNISDLEAKRIVEEFNQKMRQEEFALQKERFAWDKRMDQARLAASRSGGGGGRSSSSGSGSSSSSSSGAVKAYNAAKTTSSKDNSALGRYVSANSSSVNAGRSLARKPIEDLAITRRFLPNTGGNMNPRTDPALTAWERSQILLGR